MVKAINIFGDEIEVPVRGKHYVQPKGYAYFPGTGPKDESCGSCMHAERHARWAKCGHPNYPKHTGGRGTDILLRSPACKYWSPNTAALAKILKGKST